MERQRPDTTSNEIELYIRTYYSLLRTTGDVRVRAFEEAHAWSHSSLHEGARAPAPDVAAFGYAAGRLPECMPEIERVVLGQSDETYEAFGLQVSGWERVRTRGRRRLLRRDGKGTLATYITSTSDIDDLVPLLTTYQLEWNKLHRLLAASEVGRALVAGRARADFRVLGPDLAAALELGDGEIARLHEAFGARAEASLLDLARRPLDLTLRLLAGSFAEYQRAAQLWWSAVEDTYRGAGGGRAPVYFVSSNTHALANLLGGYALAHRRLLLETGRREAADDLLAELERAPDDANLLFSVLRGHLQRSPEAVETVQAWDAESGILDVPNRAHVDVDAQLIELSRLRPERMDPRLRVPGLERLAQSDARILNIDYPLGMGAYHLLSRVGQGVGPLLGAYVMGKAATLNGQIGDVMISRVVHDEHSKNTYLLRNAFAAQDVAPWLVRGSVLDNQKAVTVRGAFLQNPNYLGVFYREGYTVLEMEAGPYLSALYELADPRRHPNDEIVPLSERAAFDVGVLHYASDTPYSRRQWLLSKSLGWFGTDATYGCAIAITRRILEREIARLAGSR